MSFTGAEIGLLPARVSGSADFVPRIAAMISLMKITFSLETRRRGAAGLIPAARVRNLTDFNVDGFRLGLFALREMHFQHTVLELRADLIASGAFGRIKLRMNEP